MLKGVLPRLANLLLSGFLIMIISAPASVAAIDPSIYKSLQTPFYDPNSVAVGNCFSGSTSTTPAPQTATTAALDYKGRPILDQGQLQAIAANQTTYQQAASQVDIPWQMLAVVHLRENGLKKANPGNGQGIYQFYDQHGGPYPTGPVSDAEFLRQTILAAQFLKSAAGGNYPNHQLLSASSDSETVKDTFFSYNGRASAYVIQAASLGYKNNQGYEGSPYVMNKADAQRDPDSNPTGWGQIKRDNGPIEYPANEDYGAFVEYAGLAGLPINNCVSGNVRQAIVQIAQQEFQAWQSGQLKPGTDFFKYSQNRPEDWCADFVSWVYSQAGDPLSDSNGGNIASVLGIQQVGQSIRSSKFSYHDSSNYTPQPGDIAVHIGPGVEHVNIVVAVTNSKITLVGGNQGGTGGGNAGGLGGVTVTSPVHGYNASSVSEYDVSSPSGDSIVGYVTPD